MNNIYFAKLMVTFEDQNQCDINYSNVQSLVFQLYTVREWGILFYCSKYLQLFPVKRLSIYPTVVNLGHLTCFGQSNGNRNFMSHCKMETLRTLMWLCCSFPSGGRLPIPDKIYSFSLWSVN